MKHLLSGVSIAAALAIAAPVWAQTGAPMTPSAPPAASAAAPAPMATGQRHHRMRHHRMARHGTRGKMMGKMSPDNRMTEQLNQQELGRLQGGGAAPMGGAGPMPMQQGPRPSGGTGRGM